MDTAERLAAWRNEINGEIEQLETELREAHREHADSEAELAAIRADWGDLFSKVNSTPSVEGGIAEVLYSRMVNERDEATRSVVDKRARAKNAAKALEERIASRRLALRQIEESLSGKRKSEGPVILKAERREAPPVEFDTILEATP